MTDQEPAGLDGFGDEVSRMLRARALRHPDHTDPVGITKKHLRAARHRRRAAVGVTTTLALTGGAVFGVAAAYPSDHGRQAGGGTAVTPGGTTATSSGGTATTSGDHSTADTCPQSTKVPVDVPRGATTSQIAAALFQAGVIKKAKDYLDAANANQASAGITAGTYAICPGISGRDAVLELLKKSNLSDASQLIVTSHEWSKDVIASLIDKRKWKQADFDTAIADNTIGLPAWSVDAATGKFTVEGMLEPGTYSLTSADTPQSILTQMVANRMTFLKSIDFETKAATLACGAGKCMPEQVLTVASIAEGEVTDPTDAARVAEGVYQRLKANDYLGIDSTALYYLGHLPPGSLPTRAQVEDPSNPYSTYAPHHGLPPTPIYVTSDDTIRAALAPTHEGVYYWCVTATGTNFYTKTQKAERDRDCSR